VSDLMLRNYLKTKTTYNIGGLYRVKYSLT